MFRSYILSQYEYGIAFKIPKKHTCWYTVTVRSVLSRDLRMSWKLTPENTKR